MRSDSMRRFHVEHLAHGSNAGAEARRAEIQRQTEEFLAAGGKVQQLESQHMARPVYRFNYGDRDHA